MGLRAGRVITPPNDFALSVIVQMSAETAALEFPVVTQFEVPPGLAGRGLSERILPMEVTFVASKKRSFGKLILTT